MRIKIIGSDRLIAFNGQTGVVCAKGSVHEVADDFAEPLVRDKWAKVLTDPTLEEYVAAGYKAENYPPRGCVEIPSPGLTAYRAEQAADEVARAAKAEADRIAAEEAARVDAEKAAAAASQNKATGPSETK